MPRQISRLAICVCLGTAAAVAAPAIVHAQVASISAWDAADYRQWSFVPYWTETAQINTFSADGVYDHVSDVIYHAGYHPRADGTLFKHSRTDANLGRLKTDAATHGFRLMMDMFDVYPASNPSSVNIDSIWTTITSNVAIRSTFVNNVKNIVQQHGLMGVNLDWERPNTAAKWGNYTQLAADLRAALNPAGQQHRVEISVDDYGSTDTRWDETASFDARAYDQIMMMAYHYAASSQAGFANGKKNLTGQGAAKAFTDEQIVIGMGTWGQNGPKTLPLKNLVAADPNLPANATSWTGTAVAIDGNTYTATWDIVSRYEVRENVQLALDRGQPGVMFWTLHYDATNKLSLHRVAQHYAMFKTSTPDLDLNGRVDVADANALADNMGTVPGWKGTATQAQFENFYMSGNWEKGDRNGNGFVNQADADWLAGRYAALGVALPDRLAYTGTFEKWQSAMGLNGRWRAARNGGGPLTETGNFTQHNPGFLSFTGSGVGAGKFSNSSVTIRNQNDAEAFESGNTSPRQMRSTLAAPIDLAQQQETFITFLVRQNSAPLLPSQVASQNRTLSLELLNAAGQTQYDFSFFGQQTDFAIRSQADATGQDVSADGFAADATYLFIGKVSGNGADGATLSASLLPAGSHVGNFADPHFTWMLTAQGSAGFDPTITDVQFTSLFEGNFTVSNLMVGAESAFFAAPASGDFNADGVIDGNDLARWNEGAGAEGATHWQGDANGDQLVDGADFLAWQRNLGVGNVAASAAVPEPGSVALAAFALTSVAMPFVRRRHCLSRFSPRRVA